MPLSVAYKPVSYGCLSPWQNEWGGGGKGCISNSFWLIFNLMLKNFIKQFNIVVVMVFVHNVEWSLLCSKGNIRMPGSQTKDRGRDGEGENEETSLLLLMQHITWSLVFGGLATIAYVHEHHLLRMAKLWELDITTRVQPAAAAAASAVQLPQMMLPCCFGMWTDYFYWCGCYCCYCYCCFW